MLLREVASYSPQFICFPLDAIGIFKEITNTGETGEPSIFFETEYYEEAMEVLVAIRCDTSWEMTLMEFILTQNEEFKSWLSELMSKSITHVSRTERAKTLLKFNGISHRTIYNVDGYLKEAWQEYARLREFQRKNIEFNNIIAVNLNYSGGPFNFKKTSNLKAEDLSPHSPLKPIAVFRSPREFFYFDTRMPASNSKSDNIRFLHAELNTKHLEDLDEYLEFPDS